MPIYMDFHDMPDGVTAAHVAEMHQADLKIEHKYNCRGLTYWCDEKRQTAFCLIEAPNEDAIRDLHNEAHGDAPLRIIQVNDSIVESFLGRIEDPEKAQNTKLNIINDPAFRTLLVVKFEKKALRNTATNTLDAAMHGYRKSIVNSVSILKGSLVKQEAASFLVSFDSVTNAVACALKIQEIYNAVITPDLVFKIGISAGIPVTDKKGIFEDTIQMATRFTNIEPSKIVVSTEVKDLYESENLNTAIDRKKIRALSATEEQFLMQFMEYVEKEWRNPVVNVDDFSKNLGYSKSKLYRIMMAVVGKSINSFIKDYRLERALKLLDTNTKNISEIAFETGFNSAAYFTKCFIQKFAVLPSAYAKTDYNNKITP
ncbi:MAG: DUF4242 domain-containing protein [Flavobacteriaceae bacterium]|nr:DUF4242 domain-containing protein [Flavobacteriaceae bacterium]